MQDWDAHTTGMRAQQGHKHDKCIMSRQTWTVMKKQNPWDLGHYNINRVIMLHYYCKYVTSTREENFYLNKGSYYSTPYFN